MNEHDEADMEHIGTMKSKLLLIILSTLALALNGLTPVFAYAVTENYIIVSTLEDELNADGDCSLREAVQAANSDGPVDACPAGSGMDTIFLPEGQYLLSIGGANEDAGQVGDLDIHSPVSLKGAGPQDTIIDGGGLDRVFHIVGIGAVLFENLKIQNGFSTGSLYGGAGIFNEKGNLFLSRVWLEANRTTGLGGGLDNASTATLRNCSINGNQAEWGGGIFNAGMLTLLNVTLQGNSANQSGGGLDNSVNSTLTNVTLSGNTAPIGGGIFNDEDLALINTTIYHNSTGVANADTVRFKNTIVAGSTSGVNCTDKFGEIVSKGFISEGQNLEDGNECNFILASDLINTAPELGPLADNEGGLLTHALLPASPAIDRGDNLDCPTADGRGARRPADGDGDGLEMCDIGAFEFGGSLPTPVFLPLLLRR
jgi:CSLREA domain-containing protein